MKSILLSFFICLSAYVAYAQTEFDLKFKQGHYYIDAPVNGVLTKDIMVETGLHGISIREELFNELFPEHNLKVAQGYSPNQTVMEKAYKIRSAWDGSIQIGDLIFRGRIFVMENKFPIRFGINVQNLYNTSDSTRNYLNFNFKEEKMRMASFADIDTTQLSYLTTFQVHDWLITETAVTIAQEEKKYTLKGKFVVDFGNANSLSLFKNKYIANFLLKTGFKVEQIDNGTILRTSYVTINKKKYSGFNLKIINSVSQFFGYFGPDFFHGNMYISPQRDRIYYE